MTIEEFIDLFKEQFDDPDVIELTPSSKFRELPEWNSLTGLMTLAMANDNFGVILPVDMMKKAESIQDLFDMIQGLSNK